MFRPSYSSWTQYLFGIIILQEAVGGGFVEQLVVDIPALILFWNSLDAHLFLFNLRSHALILSPQTCQWIFLPSAIFVLLMHLWLIEKFMR